MTCRDRSLAIARRTPQVHSRASFRQRPRSRRTRGGPGALRTTSCRRHTGRHTASDGPGRHQPGAASRRLSPCQGSSLRQARLATHLAGLIYDSNSGESKCGDCNDCVSAFRPPGSNKYAPIDSSGRMSMHVLALHRARNFFNYPAFMA